MMVVGVLGEVGILVVVGLVGVVEQYQDQHEDPSITFCCRFLLFWCSSCSSFDMNDILMYNMLT